MARTAVNNLERVQVIEVMLLDQHKHIQTVADHLGITRQRLWQICKANGIDPHVKVKCICEFCGKEFEVGRSVVRRGSGKYCNEKCYHDHRNEIGDYQPWRLGQKLARKAVEEWLGFPLPEGFVVHHEDGDHRNFEMSNLWVFPSHSEHLKYHHAKRSGTAELPYKELWELPAKIEEWLSD